VSSVQCVRPTTPRIQCQLAGLFRQLKRSWRETHCCHSVPSLIMNGDIMSLLHMPSWCNWLRHSAPKVRGPGFDFRWSPLKVPSDLILSSFSSPQVHSAFNRNEYQGISLRLKSGRRVELTSVNSLILVPNHIIF
jgi:hypothetical protein